MDRLWTNHIASCETDLILEFYNTNDISRGQVVWRVPLGAMQHCSLGTPPNVQPLSEACTSCLTHENTRKRSAKQVNNTSAIQSVHADFQSKVMSVTDSQTENNKMFHSHHFPDLDEWVSLCGS